jgi:hypothetical protein
MRLTSYYTRYIYSLYNSSCHHHHGNIVSPQGGTDIFRSSVSMLISRMRPKKLCSGRGSSRPSVSLLAPNLIIGILQIAQVSPKPDRANGSAWLRDQPVWTSPPYELHDRHCLLSQHTTASSIRIAAISIERCLYLWKTLALLSRHAKLYRMRQIGLHFLRSLALEARPLMSAQQLLPGLWPLTGLVLRGTLCHSRPSPRCTTTSTHLPAQCAVSQRSPMGRFFLAI